MFKYTNVTLKASPLVAAVGLFFALPIYASSNLIVNGDFEAGPHDTTGSITNWTVSGTGNGATEMEGATSGNFSAALNVGSDTEGTVLSQSFTTVAGQGYVVEFDAGIFGTHSFDPLQLNVHVAGTGVLLDETITPPEAGSFNPSSVIFHHYRYPFIADGDTTTLQFTDIKTGNGAADTLIDTVSVMATTLLPPTTLPLVNGDFETNPFDTNGTVTGWSAMGVSQIAATAEGATGGTHSAALGPGGDFQDDILAQSFFTTSGQKYAVDFDAGVFGTSDFTQQLRVRLFGGSNLLDQILTPPYAGTFDPSMVQFQHYHFEVTANSSVSTIEFSDIGLGNVSSDILVDTVSVGQVAQTFAEWQSAHFTPEQQANSQISGWNADPDVDQISNGLEYFFNMDPLAGITEPNATALPRSAIEISGGSPYLTYTFRRLIGWQGNPAVVAVSGDLISWDETGNQLEPVSVTPSGDGITEIVKVRLATPIDQGPIPKKFLRLELTQ
jgi:hypothetical protein